MDCGKPCPILEAADSAILSAEKEDGANGNVRFV
jgi:hypothetical protein